MLEAVKRHRDTGELSFVGEEIDWAGIRSFSHAYPREQDWREFDAHSLADAAE